MSDLIDSNVDLFMFLIEGIRFGTQKVWQLNFELGLTYLVYSWQEYTTDRKQDAMFFNWVCVCLCFPLFEEIEKWLKIIVWLFL